MATPVVQGLGGLGGAGRGLPARPTAVLIGARHPRWGLPSTPHRRRLCRRVPPGALFSAGPSTRPTHTHGAPPRPAAAAAAAAGAAVTGGPSAPPTYTHGAPPPPPPSAAAAAAAPAGGAVTWLSVGLVLALTLSSLAAAFAASVLYVRPLLRAAERASRAAAVAAVECEAAAKEMDRMAKMMQSDLPPTMEDMRRASAEFEVLGKQLNVLVGAVAQPVRSLERVAETGLSAVAGAGLAAGVAADAQSLSQRLRATVAGFRRQVGWAGLSAEQQAEAARLAGIARRQMDARAWVARWRQRTAAGEEAAQRERQQEEQQQGLTAEADAASSSDDDDAGRGLADGGEAPRPGREAEARRAVAAVASGQGWAEWQDQAEADVEAMVELGRSVRAALGGLLGGGAGAPPTASAAEQERTAAAVVAALERAQAAAEEAAAASGVLERAIMRAESQGVLVSADDGGGDGARAADGQAP